VWELLSRRERLKDPRNGPDESCAIRVLLGTYGIIKRFKKWIGGVSRGRGQSSHLGNRRCEQMCGRISTHLEIGRCGVRGRGEYQVSTKLCPTANKVSGDSSKSSATHKTHLVEGDNGGAGDAGVRKTREEERDEGEDEGRVL
jgi:hypothetical protein